MKKSILIQGIFLSFWMTFSVNAASVIGTIVHIEGTADIIRDGSFLNRRQIVTGFQILPFDTIETAKDSFVELEMNTPAAGSTVKIGPSTTYYIDSIPTKKTSKIKATFQLLRGKLSFIVGKLERGESYNVQTDLALMAVRGTEFSVAIAPNRNVLVKADSGQVDVKSDLQTAVVNKDTIVITDERNKITSVNTLSIDPDNYENEWLDRQIEALQGNADISFEHFFKIWEQHWPRFQAAMQELDRHERIFLRWDKVSRGIAKPPSRSTAIKDKITLSRSMLFLRSQLPITERTYYTLVGLEEYTQEDNQNFKRRKKAIRKILSKSRQVVRIFKYIESEVSGRASDFSIMDYQKF